MSGRKLSSSGASLPAAKKQHQQKEQTAHSLSNTTSGKKHTASRRGSTNTKKSGSQEQKYQKTYNKRRTSGSKAQDANEKKLKLTMDLHVCEANPVDEVLESPVEETTIAWNKYFSLYSECVPVESTSSAVDSVLRLSKCCKGGVVIKEEMGFPDCCFSVDTKDDVVSQNFHKIQIIGLGLKLKELLY